MERTFTSTAYRSSSRATALWTVYWALAQISASRSRAACRVSSVRLAS